MSTGELMNIGVCGLVQIVSAIHLPPSFGRMAVKGWTMGVMAF